MASSGRKMVIQESEKSQKVQMINWVADARHARQLRSLSRSEKAVKGRITVDQKLLYKRYNNRLHHSRITFARITENRQLEKELLSKVHLNTDVGLEGENDDMLQRIWGSGSMKMEQIRRMRNSRRSRDYESQFKLRIRSLKEDEDERDEALEETCISRPTTARSLRALKSYRAGQRPHTAIGKVENKTESSVEQDVEQETEDADDGPGSGPKVNEETMSTPVIRVVIENEFGDRVQGDSEKMQSMVKQLDHCEITGKEEDKGSHDTRQNVPPTAGTVFKVTQANKEDHTRDSTTAATVLPDINVDKVASEEGAIVNKEEDKQDETKGEPKEPAFSVDNRPKTVAGHSSAFFSPGSQVPTRRVSISHRPSHHHQHHHNVKIGSLFPEETKPSLLELHKVKMKLANYDGRIKKFGDSLGDMLNKSQSSGDYYNIRLQSSTEAELSRKREALRKTYEDLVTTTEGEYRRWKGNMNLRSMTAKTVDWDFKRRPSTYIDVSMY